MLEGIVFLLGLETIVGHLKLGFTHVHHILNGISNKE